LIRCVDQAIGIVRARTGGTADDAFARLRRISQAETPNWRWFHATSSMKRCAPPAPGTPDNDPKVALRAGIRHGAG
jgi:hypothetical protein